jgi:hypothetical protein
MAAKMLHIFGGGCIKGSFSRDFYSETAFSRDFYSETVVMVTCRTVYSRQCNCRYLLCVGDL